MRGIVTNEISEKTIIMERVIKSAVPVMFTSSIALFLSFVSRYSVKIGMKAALKAPSPKRRRKRFGILKAITKASQAIPVPKKLAQIMSRAKPKILLNRVQRLIVLAERKKFFFSLMIRYG